MIDLLNRNEEQINRVVRAYQGEKDLTVFKGQRQTIPTSLFPSFEIEPDSAANRWAATRTQRPRFTFRCMLTVSNSIEKFGVEYSTTLATVIAAIMTSPENLQMVVKGETRWVPNGGLEDTRIMDSLVESVTYSSNRDGSMRVAEFDWFVEINEPFPEAKWGIKTGTTPTILRPVISE